MKNRKNTTINYNIIGVFIFLIAMFYSCSDNNKEVPERQKTTTKRYVLPTPQPLSDAEREFINNRRNEYLKAVE